MSDEPSEWYCGQCGAQDEDDCICWEDDLDCWTCGGDGWVIGADIAHEYDIGWINPDKAYRCTNCGGSGARKDMTSW